jgi:hypothetical protein
MDRFASRAMASRSNTMTSRHSSGSADTAWNGALLSTPKDWEFYLKERARQKFSAVQWVTTQWRASPNGDASGAKAFTGKKRFPSMRNSFSGSTPKRTPANKAGLLNVPCASLGDWRAQRRTKSRRSAVRGPGDSPRALHGRALAGQTSVAWILAGDGHYFGAQAERWKRIGRAVFGDIAHAPVIMHPQGRHWIQHEFKNEKWLDIVGYQSGHGDSDESLQWLTRGPLVQDWNVEPHRPLINLEPPYEGHLGYQSKQPLSADLVRRTLYWSLLNAPTAGVSYGGHGVWGWDDGTKPPTDHPNTGTPLPWQKALTLPCAEQMTNLVNFFTSIDFQHLRPMPRSRREQSGHRPPRESIVVAARSENKDTYGRLRAGRSDGGNPPRIAAAIAGCEVVQSAHRRKQRCGRSRHRIAPRSFPTPGEGDWILWMQTQKK